MKVREIRVCSIAALFALLAACATTRPETDSAVQQARAAVHTLEIDPLASQIAGKPLQDARTNLAAAEKAESDHRPDDEVIHLAYLARRNAEIGQAMIAENRAQKMMADAQAQRQQVLLSAREREAAAARQQAQQAQAQAQQSQAQAQQSQQQAQEAAAQAQAAQQQAAAAQTEAQSQIAAANEQAAAAKAQLEALQAKQTERGMVLTLGSNVLFDTNSDVLKPGADAALGRIADFMNNQSGERLRIEGHTDSRGSDSYNDALSQRRAEAVAQALESHGVDSSRIQAVGRGKSLPVATNDTAAGRQQNRRVELVFSDTQGQFASTH